MKHIFVWLIMWQLEWQWFLLEGHPKPFPQFLPEILMAWNVANDCVSAWMKIKKSCSQSYNNPSLDILRWARLDNDWKTAKRVEG
jgi:hypothetical protein